MMFQKIIKEYIFQFNETVKDRMAFGRIRPNFDSKIVIVSAADSTHFASIIQLIKSCIESDSNAEIIIFDLGLTKKQVDFISTQFKINPKPFPYKDFPEWFDIKQKAGSFGWKPWIILQTAIDCDGILIWMDAGNKVISKLDRTIGVIEKFGFFAMSSSGCIRQWTHPDAIQEMINLGFNISDELLNKQNLSAACLGFNLKNNRTYQLIETWANLALEKKVISPENSSNENHRYDQSVLSIIHHEMKFPNWRRFPSGNKYGFLIHQDVESL